MDSNVFKIEKDKPIPRGTSARYPFSQMEVGDSFFAPKAVSTVSQSARKFAIKNPGYHFSCRRETYEGQDGTRCWRVE